MNPNSANQRWSKWVITIRPGGTKKPPFATVKANCARFGRSRFGSASNMRVTAYPDRVLVEVLTEGSPVHDPQFVSHMRAMWDGFAAQGWGRGTTVELDARLMAGSRQDGTPSDQLIIAPPIIFDEEAYARSLKEQGHGSLHRV